jgi:hypothetical protein
VAENALNVDDSTYGTGGFGQRAAVAEQTALFVVNWFLAGLVPELVLRRLGSISVPTVFG